MTFADLYFLFDQVTPFFGAFVISAWLWHDLKKARAEIAAYTDRLKEIEHKLSVCSTDEDLVEQGFDPKDEQLPLPQPLPQATARYRS